VTRRAVLIWVAAGSAALALTGVGLVLARDDDPAATVPTGRNDRSGVRVAGRDVVTGQRVDLASYRGTPTVIAIWAAWCPPCQEDGPVFARFTREHPDVAFVGVDYQDGPEAARAFIRTHGWRFSSIADPQGRLAQRLGMQHMPTTIVLDARHREVARVVGATTAAELERLVRRGRS
jgi:thiol-disulfide isomerase/thioredoxin